VCLLLFLVFWVGLIASAAVGYQHGDPQRLVYSSDSTGRVCGGKELPNDLYTVYPRAEEDALDAGQAALSTPWTISFYSVCVDACPSQGDLVCNDLGWQLVKNESTVRNKSIANVQNDCVNSATPFFLPSYFSTCDSPLIRINCWTTMFDTVPVLFRCFPKYLFESVVLPESGCTEFKWLSNPFTGVPYQTCVKYRQVVKTTTEEPTGNDLLFGSFNTIYQDFERYIGDLVKAGPVILVSGILVAIVVGMFFMLALWCFVAVVVWGTVWGVLIMSVAFTVYLYVKAGKLQISGVSAAAAAIANASSSGNTAGVLSGFALINASAPDLNGTIQTLANGSAIAQAVSSGELLQANYLNFAYAMTAVTILIFLLILMLFSRIHKAVLIFQEASMAIKANPLLICVPLCATPVMIALIVFWITATMYLASAGEYSLQTPAGTLNTTLGPNTPITTIPVLGKVSYNEGLIAYQFLGFLWSANVISAFVVYIVSGTTGHWYWNGAPDSGDSYGNHPMVMSTWVPLRFHMGTIAFGSLLISLVQLVRYVAAYLEAKTQNQTTSRTVKIIWCLVHYCLKCLEMCVRFISRNAFIMSSMYGENFCTSARMAFSTIMSNLAQVALVNFLGDIILRFGQFFITITACFACWLYLDHDPRYGFGGSLELHTFWFPVLVTALLAWFVGNEVLSVYDITVETLLLQYCQDIKLSRVDPNRPTLPDKSFDKFVDAHGPSKENPDDANRLAAGGAFGKA
jgi:choline transporter-like protein 2/4/5